LFLIWSADAVKLALVTRALGHRDVANAVVTGGFNRPVNLLLNICKSYSETYQVTFITTVDQLQDNKDRNANTGEQSRDSIKMHSCLAKNNRARPADPGTGCGGLWRRVGVARNLGSGNSEPADAGDILHEGQGVFGAGRPSQLRQWGRGRSTQDQSQFTQQQRCILGNADPIQTLYDPTST